MKENINKVLIKSTEMYLVNFLYKQKLLKAKEYEHLKKIL